MFALLNPDEFAHKSPVTRFGRVVLAADAEVDWQNNFGQEL
jgi:hypothetical protein